MASTGSLERNNESHYVFYIELEKYECYIMDLTGAQYGHYAPVMPYDIYFSTLGVYLEEETGDPLGTTQKGLETLASAYGKLSPATIESYGSPLRREMRKIACRYSSSLAINAEIRLWRDRAGACKVDEMLQLPHSEYRKEQAAFLAIARDVARTYAEAHNERDQQYVEETKS